MSISLFSVAHSPELSRTIIIVSFSLAAARQAQEVVENTQRIVAGEALIAAHAQDLRSRQMHRRPSMASRAVCDSIRSIVPPDTTENHSDPIF